MALIEGRVIRRTLVLAMVGAALLPASGDTQVFPHRVEVGKYTCGEILSLSGEARARMLIYFNGYLDGRSGTSVWDDQMVGARIDRALDSCKAAPALPLLDAFARAWKP